MSILLSLCLIAAQQPATAQTDHAPLRDNPNRRFQLKDLKTTKVAFGSHVVDCWVMDTDAKREEGMMFLESQDFTEHQGMIFVFKSAEPLRFWMKNTFVKLDIVYGTAGKKVDTMYTMEAFDTTTDYSSKNPAMYAIELKDGVLKKWGTKEGSAFTITPIVKAKD